MAACCEVVITGVGVISPIGIGSEAFWDSLLAGRSGIRPLSFAQGTDLPVQFGGEVQDFEGKKYVKPRKSIKLMSREIQIGYAATMMAMEDAGLKQGDVDPDRLGGVLGAEMFNCELEELAAAYRKCVVDGEIRAELWGEGAMSDLYPLWMLKYLPNMVACHAAIALDARGPNNTITLDEVSGLLSLIEAVCIIQRGAADVMFAGGTGTRVNLTRMLYRGDHDWSHRSDDPAAACRPFDAMRDGGVVGEGAAAFVLERREFAEARGVKPLARIRGFGRSYQTIAKMGAPVPEAISRSINAALQSAQIEPSQLGHVNAHGASTLAQDRAEAQAIRQTLGEVPVTAPKSFFGCLSAAASATELAVSVLATEKGTVPHTLNYQYPDPECPINVIRDQPLRPDSSAAMILSQAEMGQAVAVVIDQP